MSSNHQNSNYQSNINSPRHSDQPHAQPKSIWRRIDDVIFIAPKLLYITMSFAFYAFYLLRANFSTKYLELSKSQFGDLSAMMAAVGFLSMAPWGKVADATGRHRLVLAFSTFGMAASFMLFLIRFDSPVATFWSAALILALYSFFSCALQPLTDYHALKMLERQPGLSRDLYGRQRVWGTIAYGAISFIMGSLTKSFGPVALFYVVPITSALFVITIFAVTYPDSPIPLRQAFSRQKVNESALDNSASTTQLLDGDVKKVVESPNKSDVSLVKKGEPIDVILDPGDIVHFHGEPPRRDTRKPLVQLLTNPDYVFLLVFVFLSGTARAVMTSFAAMYWNEDMDLTTRQIGVAANFGILMEIGLFFAAPFLLGFFGIYWMLIFSQTAMVLRCWVYAFLPAKPSMFWVVYLTELLKGVAFGFGQTAGVKICGDVAPPGLEATAQALYTSFYSQLPAVIAAAAGGRLYQHFGGKVLFYTTAILSTVALGLFLLKYTLDGRLCGSRRHVRPSRNPEN